MPPRSGRCRHCRCLFIFNPRLKDQRYCARRECQRVRRRLWQRQKMATDADYQQNQRAAQKTLATRAPGVLAAVPRAPSRLRRDQPQASAATRPKAKVACKNGRIRADKPHPSRHLLPAAGECGACKDGRVSPKNHIDPGALPPSRGLLQTRTRLPSRAWGAITRP